MTASRAVDDATLRQRSDSSRLDRLALNPPGLASIPNPRLSSSSDEPDPPAARTAGGLDAEALASRVAETAAAARRLLSASALSSSAYVARNRRRSSFSSEYITTRPAADKARSRAISEPEHARERNASTKTSAPRKPPPPAVPPTSFDAFLAHPSTNSNACRAMKYRLWRLNSNRVAKSDCATDPNRSSVAQSAPA